MGSETGGGGKVREGWKQVVEKVEIEEAEVDKDVAEVVDTPSDTSTDMLLLGARCTMGGTMVQGALCSMVYYALWCLVHSV